MKLKGIELKGTYKVKFEDNWLQVYDEKGNQTYYENRYGHWAKREYDDNGNQIYYEDSYEVVIDRRPKPIKELTVNEISKLLGYEVKIIKEK